MTALLPDALVMLAVVLAWLNDTFVGQAGRRTTYFLAFFSTLIAGIWFAVNAFDPQVHYFFGHMYVVDSFANVMKAVVTLGYAVSIVYSRRTSRIAGCSAASSSSWGCSRCSVSS
jgi:NADH-quinone oxidoreductase subunit N